VIVLGSFGGFYKGEKKKAKKNTDSKKSFGDAPSFVMPEIISKKDKR